MFVGRIAVRNNFQEAAPVEGPAPATVEAGMDESSAPAQAGEESSPAPGEAGKDESSPAAAMESGAPADKEAPDAEPSLAVQQQPGAQEGAAGPSAASEAEGEAAPEAESEQAPEAAAEAAPALAASSAAEASARQPAERPGTADKGIQYEPLEFQPATPAPDLSSPKRVRPIRPAGPECSRLPFSNSDHRRLRSSRPSAGRGATTSM